MPISESQSVYRFDIARRFLHIHKDPSIKNCKLKINNRAKLIKVRKMKFYIYKI